MMLLNWLKKAWELFRHDIPGWLQLVIGLLAVIVAIRVVPPIVNVILPSPTLVITQIFPVVSQPPLPTHTLQPTYTRQPTLTPYPTYTPIPTHTSLPEPTSTLMPSATSTPEFYQELEEVDIAPQVTILLGAEFVDRGYVGCYTGGDYIVAFFIRNNSNRQFLLRYESSGVTVEDNLGHKYAVSETGIDRCPSDRGLRSETIEPGNQDTLLMVAFNGEFGLDVKYLVITIDNISGTGPYRFRKDL